MAITVANIVGGGASVFIGADLGAVKEGITITVAVEHYKVEGIEGLLTAPKAYRTKEEYTIAFTLVEPTLANVKLAWDVTNAIVTPGPPITLEFGGDSATPQSRVLKVFGIVPGNVFVRTIQFDNVIASAPGETKLTQFQEQSLPCTYVTLWDAVNSRVGQFSDATS